MSEKEIVLGSAVELVQTESGQYEAVQVQSALGLPPWYNDQGRRGIDWAFGPTKVAGYVDTDRLEIGLAVSVLGIPLGNIYGSLRDGVALKINLTMATGSLRFYLKNGNEVWVNVDISVKFDGSFDGDYKIITF